MREMKDSGIEWLGEIPINWNLEQVSSIFEERNTKVNDTDYPPLSVTKKGILDQIETVAKSDDHANRKLVKAGDFVINSRSDRRNSCGFSSKDGSVSLINIVLCPTIEISAKYFDNLFDTVQFGDEFYSLGQGIVADLWTTNWSNMKKIVLPVPGYEEQLKIADFLDIRCREIDAAIEAAEKSIDEYKDYKKALIFEAVTKGLDPTVEMKDSGIEWLGEIPATWRIKPFKYCYSQVKRAFRSNLQLLSVYLNLGVIPYSQSDGMQVHKPSESLEKYQVVKPNDLVLNNQQAWRGSVGVSEWEGIISPAYHVFEPLTDELLPKFANYLFRHVLVPQFTITSRGVGTIQRSISVPDFLSMAIVVLPSVEEQALICTKIEVAETAINNAIATKQSIIEDLKAYKKSLIYEVVTGKREINGR